MKTTDQLTRFGDVDEDELVRALQPYRGFVVASVLHGFLERGLYDALAERPRPVQELADAFDLDPERLRAVLLFLANEDLVAFNGGDVVAPTQRLTEVGKVRAWYEMMIGGYAETFLQMGDKLAAGSGPASRNGEYVGRGSCGISLHDSLPIVHRLLEVSGREHRLMLDLGCGSGIYLTELCRAYPELRGVGIEPDEGARDAAVEFVAAEGLSDRIDIELANAVDYLNAGKLQPDLALLGFVIHEVLGQRGEEGVRQLLGALFDASPGADLIVIDVDHQLGSPEHMRHPLAQTYYNGYYLLHPFTSQRLEPIAYWEQLYDSCGVEVVDRQTTDPSVDSTGLEVGWLLRRRGG